MSIMKAMKLFLLAALGGFFVVNFSFAQTWTQTSAPIAWWKSIACSADGTKLTATVPRFLSYDGGETPVVIYVSTNSGNTWSVSTNTGGWQTIASSADGNNLLATYFVGSARIFTSTNSGATWALADTFSANVGTAASSADGHALIVGTYPQGAGVFISTNSGLTWFNITTTANGFAIGGYGVACSADGTKMFAVGANFPETGNNSSHVCVSINSGVKWTAVQPTANWSSIACSADGKKLVASVFGGVIWTSTNSGATWITNNVPSINWFCVASSADGSKLAAVCEGGGIYTSTNSGTIWTSNNISSQDWWTVATSADGNKLVAGALPQSSDGGIFTSYSPSTLSMSTILTNGNLTLSWTVSSTNFILQQSCDLFAWTDLTNTPVLNLTNLQNEITVPMSSGNNFYRLKTP